MAYRPALGASIGDVDDRVLSYVTDYIADNHYPPSQREIAAALKVGVMTVNRALHRLHQSGRIVLHPGVSPRLLLGDPATKMVPPVEEL